MKTLLTQVSSTREAWDKKQLEKPPSRNILLAITSADLNISVLFERSGPRGMTVSTLLSLLT